MNNLAHIVLKRLEAKGMNSEIIPPYIRDIANVYLSSAPGLLELNRKLSILGWEGFELDDHTFQLIEAVIENECYSNNIELKNSIVPRGISIPLLFKEPTVSSPL